MMSLYCKTTKMFQKIAIEETDPAYLSVLKKRILNFLRRLEEQRKKVIASWPIEEQKRWINLYLDLKSEAEEKLTEIQNIEKKKLSTEPGIFLKQVGSNIRNWYYRNSLGKFFPAFQINNEWHFEDPERDTISPIPDEHLNIVSKIRKMLKIMKKKEKEEKSELEEVLEEKSKFGDYVPGSGVGKSGYYKGYWCDSSNELAWVIYHLDNEIEFERNQDVFSYEYENKTRWYSPDFIKNGKYIEIKGSYITPQTLAKIKQFPEDKELKIIIEDSEEYQKIYDYVVENYGEDFTDLYEGRAGFADELKKKRERSNEKRIEKGLEPIKYERPSKESI